MNDALSITYPWFDVQWHLGQVHVARQIGGLPPLQPDQVLVGVQAAGICAADIRVVTGNKASAHDPTHYITLGHEGVGRVLACGSNVVTYKEGDHVVILPHVRPDQPCLSGMIDPIQIGNGHTRHMGWQVNGCFADFIVVSTENIARISPEHCRRARGGAPDLQEAVFALVEPMMCTLSAYRLIEDQAHWLLHRAVEPGCALVIGCGPIGILHSLLLLARGFEVWVSDSLAKRATLARWCLKQQIHVLDPAQHNDGFDLVMITASSSQAIKTGEELVRNGGIIYVSARLNSADQSAMNADKVFFYERLHRTAQGLFTTARLTGGDKSILYLGHSGYFADLADLAINTVAAHAAVLDRSITGIMRGWDSPCIEARLPGAADWATTDGSPAIVAVLQGLDLRQTHCKLIVLSNSRQSK